MPPTLRFESGFFVQLYYEKGRNYHGDIKVAVNALRMQNKGYACVDV